MNSRWFNMAVVILWLATMTWLVKEKVLPPLLYGDPPGYSEIVEAQNREPPVGWKVSLGGRPLGWALTDTKRQKSGMTEIHGRVHFDSLPLDAMMPGWLKPFSKLIGKPLNDLRLDARSELLIDPFGRLLRFDSTVRLDPLNQIVSMRGEVEGRQLQLVVRSGNLSFTHDVALPQNALLSDALSPQTRLPGLHTGQTWTVPVFSPLWPSKNPLEIIRAKVEGKEPIYWNGTMEDAWLVAYRSDTGVGAADSQTPKGKLWVRRDGAVLQQQTVLFDSTIVFVRLSEKESEKRAKEAGRQWWVLETELPSDPPVENHD